MCEILKCLWECLDILLNSLASVFFAWSLFQRKQEIINSYKIVNVPKGSVFVGQTSTFEYQGEAYIEEHDPYKKPYKVSMQTHKDNQAYINFNEHRENYINNNLKLRDAAIIASLCIIISSIVSIFSRLENLYLSIITIVLYSIFAFLIFSAVKRFLNNKYKVVPIKKPAEIAKFEDEECREPLHSSKEYFTKNSPNK